MKKIFLTLLLSFLTLNANAALKAVNLERIECYFANGPQHEYCVVFVRDIYNTTGLGLIYKNVSYLLETLPSLRSQIFYLNTDLFKQLSQKNLREQSYFDKMFYFVEALDNGEASLSF